MNTSPGPMNIKIQNRKAAKFRRFPENCHGTATTVTREEIPTGFGLLELFPFHCRPFFATKRFLSRFRTFSEYTKRDKYLNYSKTSLVRSTRD